MVKTNGVETAKAQLWFDEEGVLHVVIKVQAEIHVDDMRDI
jgi:hypothetical protein